LDDEINQFRFVEFLEIEIRNEKREIIALWQKKNSQTRNEDERRNSKRGTKTSTGFRRKIQ
jgi:hypothetical protein